MPALIFDYDGLLADTEELAATVLVELLAERGVTTDFASMVPFFGSTGPDNDAAWDRQVQAWLGPDADPVAFDAVAWELIEARRHEVPLCAGVAELLDDAARRAGRSRSAPARHARGSNTISGTSACSTGSTRS